MSLVNLSMRERRHSDFSWLASGRLI